MVLPAASLSVLQVLAATATLATAAGVVGPVGQLNIVNKVIAPDGYTRSTVLAGGTFPGPLVSGTKGGGFDINVVDQLTDHTMLKSTSIHWHGLFQNKTNFMDGPAFVTQCPIVPGNSFQYSFKTGQQAGTYWYHSHLSTQYCDGLRGPLVIYDPADPQKHLYDVDDTSTVLTLADWYHYPAPSHPAVPAFNSTLFNGLGRYLGGPLSELAVLSVEKGKRYRIRLVSISCDPNWIFSIDGHEMTIIEVEGVNSQPLTVDSIQIFAGQRYSFVLTANQPIGNYWMRAQPTLALPGVNMGFANGTNSAILRYVGAHAVEPTTPLKNSTNPLVEQNLHPLVRTPVPGKHYPGGADKNINLAIEFNGTNFFMNNATFTPPNVPVLLQILSGASAAQELLPPGSIYQLEPNEVVEISIPGGSVGAPHPFHLHGHNFWVVRSAGNSTYNWDNPPIRDVVTTGSEHVRLDDVPLRHG
ncbi:Laccase I [Mycena chlorophos]|uniref:Laccase I n=1 Tax=Mycena chlorophos TaxID=658473 RepID=A0A8H6SDI3_MYCCL|nr:Laccase I [Mycena chlorophos]